VAVNVVLTHVDGGCDELAELAQLEQLLAELDAADREHPDVAVSVESGWTLSAFANGLLVWENVESDASPGHRAGLSRAEQLRVMTLLAVADLEAVEAMGWEPGYGC
jgi:hypothetical protein